MKVWNLTFDEQTQKQHPMEVEKHASYDWLQNIFWEFTILLDLLNVVTASSNRLMGVSFFTRLDGVGKNSHLSLGALFVNASLNALEFDISPIGLSSFLSAATAGIKIFWIWSILTSLPKDGGVDLLMDLLQGSKYFGYGVYELLRVHHYQRYFQVHPTLAFLNIFSSQSLIYYK